MKRSLDFFPPQLKLTGSNETFGVEVRQARSELELEPGQD